jgi:gentisate 1,2-dioxygenase
MDMTRCAADDEEAGYALLERLETAPLWRRHGSLFTAEPPPKAVPFVWRYGELRPALVRLGEGLPLELADRRVLMMINPGLREQAATVSHLFAGFQMILPGETAPTHRHAANAFRFIVEGEGASTTVDGEKIPMAPGDLLLTPGWSWHDHAHAGDGPMIWLDGLDYPLVNVLGLCFFEAHRRAEPPPRTRPLAALFSHARMNPVLPGPQAPSGGGSPQLSYPWTQTEAALEAIGFEVEGAHTQGVVLEYVDPTSGGPVLPTISCRIVRLPPGFEGAPRRRTAGEVVHVVRGSGASIVDGRRFDWTARDILAVPTWSTCRHLNASATEDVVLFCYCDEPAVKALGFYREDGGPAQ